MRTSMTLLVIAILILSGSALAGRTGRTSRGSRRATTRSRSSRSARTISSPRTRRSSATIRKRSRQTSNVHAQKASGLRLKQRRKTSRTRSRTTFSPRTQRTAGQSQVQRSRATRTIKSRTLSPRVHHGKLHNSKTLKHIGSLRRGVIHRHTTISKKASPRSRTRIRYTRRRNTNGRTVRTYTASPVYTTTHIIPSLDAIPAEAASPPEAPEPDPKDVHLTGILNRTIDGTLILTVETDSGSVVYTLPHTFRTERLLKHPRHTPIEIILEGTLSDSDPLLLARITRAWIVTPVRLGK
jgi:hypothetical protein